MIPVEKVKLIIATYKKLEQELASGDIDKKDFVKKSKEYSSISEIINEAKSYAAFKDDKELAEKRKEAGAVLESAVMIPISDEHLTNYPDAYTNH